MTRGLPFRRSLCRWLCAGLASLFLAQSAHTHPVTRANLGEESVGVYLNPNTGRFWTMDSYEGIYSEPLSLHKYLYCQADPINRIDPSGNTSVAEVGLANLMGNILARGGALVRLYQIKQRIETVFEFLDILRTLQDLPAMLQGEIGSLISSANPHNGPLSSFSLSHFEATVQQVMSDMPTIARLALGTHRKELTEFFGRTATRKTAKDARVVIYLPTASAGGPRIVRDTPLQVRGTKLSVVAGGGGGRFWGVGIGKKVHGRIEPYQLFRVDYHGVRIRHHMSHTKFFNAEGHEFHWTVPHNPQEARD